MKRRNSQAGGSAVEFALILPLLLLILFAIIEYGFILYDQAVITNASREGARTGIVFRVDDDGTPIDVSIDEIKGRVGSYTTSRLISFGSSPAVVDTDVAGTCTAAPHARTVTVTYPYTFLIVPNFAKSIAGRLTVHGETVMNCENQ